MGFASAKCTPPISATFFKMEGGIFPGGDSTLLIAVIAIQLQFDIAVVGLGENPMENKIGNFYSSMG